MLIILLVVVFAAATSVVKPVMYDVDTAEEGFHTKGYIFRKDEVYRIIIGSSNITSAALTSNREWNTRLISTTQGEITKEIIAEFCELWDSEYALAFEAFYEQYRERYKIIQVQRKTAKREAVVSIEKYRLQPNSMQVGFITNLKKILAMGEDRALLISATGDSVIIRTGEENLVISTITSDLETCLFSCIHGKIDS